MGCCSSVRQTFLGMLFIGTRIIICSLFGLNAYAIDRGQG